jgi:hypothetical protein
MKPTSIVLTFCLAQHSPTPTGALYIGLHQRSKITRVAFTVIAGMFSLLAKDEITVFYITRSPSSSFPLIEACMHLMISIARWTELMNRTSRRRRDRVIMTMRHVLIAWSSSQVITCPASFLQAMGTRNQEAGPENLRRKAWKFQRSGKAHGHVLVCINYIPASRYIYIC